MMMSLIPLWGGKETKKEEGKKNYDQQEVDYYAILQTTFVGYIYFCEALLTSKQVPLYIIY